MMTDEEKKQDAKIENLLGEERIAAGNAAAEATGLPLYNSAADFDAHFTKMLADEEAKNREREEKKIERQKIAQSMSDLGAVFGDVIKASHGAVVTPREVRAKYDTLDKNAQAVYDNYRTRMDALRKKIRDNAQGDRDDALKADQDAKDFDEKLRLYGLKAADKKADKEADRSFKREMEEKKGNFSIKRSYITHRGGKGKEPVWTIETKDGKKYRYNKSDGRSTIINLFDRMIDWGLLRLNFEDITKDEMAKGMWKESKDGGPYTFNKETKENLSLEEKYEIIQRVINMGTDEVVDLVDKWLSKGIVGHLYKDEGPDEEITEEERAQWRKEDEEWEKAQKEEAERKGKAGESKKDEEEKSEEAEVPNLWERGWSWNTPPKGGSSNNSQGSSPGTGTTGKKKTSSGKLY